MTTHELARLLLDGPDLMVTRRGYEGGVHEIAVVQLPRPIHLNANGSRSYVGPHEYHEDGWCSQYDLDDEYEGTHPAPTDLAVHLS